MIEKAIAVKGDCSHGATLTTSQDDYTSSQQQFYLGQHGSIFSAHCPGLVIAISNDEGGSNSISLQTFQLNEKKMKWKFATDTHTIDSVAYPDMILARGASDALVSKSKDGNSNEGVWKRVNTRLLNKIDASSEWKQTWTVSFVDDGYSGNATTLSNLILDQSTDKTCYDVNPAFSPSFEDFAKGLSITDASDEEECGDTREELGFDKDHLFDVEVLDNFHEHQVSHVVYLIYCHFDRSSYIMLCLVVRSVLYDR